VKQNTFIDKMESNVLIYNLCNDPGIYIGLETKQKIMNWWVKLWCECKRI